MEPPLLSGWRVTWSKFPSCSTLLPKRAFNGTTDIAVMLLSKSSFKLLLWGKP